MTRGGIRLDFRCPADPTTRSRCPLAAPLDDRQYAEYLSPRIRLGGEK
jgi:hypothetical protein